MDLQEGDKDAELGLDFPTGLEGAVCIAGHLNAEDLDGNSFVLPFAFQVQIARVGRPYGTLKDARKPLGRKRFLLMLDEADLIPERHLGDLLPGFLRALMQEPQYPTVLLFCGTTRLKAMGREYFSILFNTAQFRTVSYLTAGESAEVLEKPARGVLEYAPAILADAWRLTRGQPLLLQLIGANLINAFNEQMRRGEERSDGFDHRSGRPWTVRTADPTVTP